MPRAGQGHAGRGFGLAVLRRVRERLGIEDRWAIEGQVRMMGESGGYGEHGAYAMRSRELLPARERGCLFVGHRAMVRAALTAAGG